MPRENLGLAYTVLERDIQKVSVRTANGQVHELLATRKTVMAYAEQKYAKQRPAGWHFVCASKGKKPPFTLVVSDPSDATAQKHAGRFLVAGWRIALQQEVRIATPERTFKQLMDALAAEAVKLPASDRPAFMARKLAEIMTPPDVVTDTETKGIKPQA